MDKQIDTESTPRLFATFTTVFFVLGPGFAMQRLRPLSEQTLVRLAGLAVEVLLPFYLLLTPAIITTLEPLSIAPLLVAIGILVPLYSQSLVFDYQSSTKVSEVALFSILK